MDRFDLLLCIIGLIVGALACGVNYEAMIDYRHGRMKEGKIKDRVSVVLLAVCFVLVMAAFALSSLIG